MRFQGLDAAERNLAPFNLFLINSIEDKQMNIDKAKRIATPGPWMKSYVLTPEGIENCDFNITGSNYHQVCKCVCPYGLSKERAANAALLTHCFNHFMPLLETLKAIMDAPIDGEDAGTVALTDAFKIIAKCEEVEGL